MLLCKYSIQTIEEINASLLLESCALIFVFSILTEKSKNDSVEFEMFSFLSGNFEGCIFLKLLPRARWTFIVHKLSLKRNVLLKSALYVNPFLVSNSCLFSHNI